MSQVPKNPQLPSFVVLRKTDAGTWQFLGEVRRKPGLTAQAARTDAILQATGGAATGNEVYAAVLASEWRIAQEWNPPLN